jgi:glycosyltransferase involved in cell wall biosynthesis
MISVIIPVYNALATIRQCLQAISDSEQSNFEIVVVDDGSTDGSKEAIREYPVQLIELEGGPCGPAYARNQGAQAARGDILFFIDADVLVRPDTLSKVAAEFEREPKIDALFGSYDESPGGSEFFSQYKNLLHHFVHQNGREDAGTFWTGCGAIRKQVFLDLGGFNAQRYPEPSIEDIELGRRLKARGHKILLSKDIQVTHLKRWSLPSLIKTDFLNRAVPWTQLIMQDRDVPNDLNLTYSQRISAMLLLILMLYLGINAFRNNILLLPLITALFLLLTNSWGWSEGSPYFEMSRRGEKYTYLMLGAISMLALYSNASQLITPLAVLLPVTLVGKLLSRASRFTRHLIFGVMMLTIAAEFLLLLAIYPLFLVAPIIGILIAIMLLNNRLYLFLARKRGLIFALAALPMQLLYYFYSMVAFVIGGSLHFWRSSFRTK